MSTMQQEYQNSVYFQGQNEPGFPSSIGDNQEVADMEIEVELPTEGNGDEEVEERDAD